jgi:Tol biopolymer transport system component
MSVPQRAGRRRTVMSSVGKAAIAVLSCVAIGLALCSPTQAAFPGRNGDIAFVGFGRRDDADVFTMKPDGSGKRNITDRPGFDVSPAYSSDGRRVAFTSSRSEPPGFDGNERLFSELYIMDADGSHVRRITDNYGFIDWQPAWSPDGRRLVFAHGDSTPPAPEAFVAPTDLWIVDLQTGELRDLTNSPNTWENYAQWSPDGERIAFDGDISAPGNNDVYTIRPNGRDLRRLTSGPSFDEAPNYSPDGSSIAFDSDRTGNFDVFTMRADGTHPTQLTADTGADYSPCFSPDDHAIAFVSDRDGAPVPEAPEFRFVDIFRMRTDGSHQINLTRSPISDDFDPDWQAR